MAHSVIPGPAGRLLVGNLFDIDPEHPIQSLCRLTQTYGAISRFRLGNQERIIIASQALMNEVCDEERFSKTIASILEQVRNGLHDGLGTAYGPQERNWGITHGILLPCLGPLAIINMFDDMHDIASELAMKWARHGPDYVIHVAEDFTRSTLDTIALCATGHRFNSFYRGTKHPFAEAMAGFLKTSVDRSRRHFLAQLFHFAENHRYWSHVEDLRKMSLDVVNKRKSLPEGAEMKKNLLDAMLHGVDPETGEKMAVITTHPDDSVVNNMMTFLIVGHETTAGLLSFAFYYLLKNPSAYLKARQEVDETVGISPIVPGEL